MSIILANILGNINKSILSHLLIIESQILFQDCNFKENKIRYKILILITNAYDIISILYTKFAILKAICMILPCNPCKF